MDKKKAITAAVTMKPAVSRRRLLVGIAAASASAAAIAAPEVADAAVIQDPLERAKFHADQLAAAMAEINPAMQWKVEIGTEANFAVVVGQPKKPKPVYDGPNFYEVELSNGKRPILWLERHDYQTFPGHYYTGAHRWGNKFETKPRRFSEKQISFIRKIENFGRA